MPNVRSWNVDRTKKDLGSLGVAVTWWERCRDGPNWKAAEETLLQCTLPPCWLWIRQQTDNNVQFEAHVGGRRAALLAVWAAQALLLAFALKLKVSAAAAAVAAVGPGPARLGSFQVQTFVLNCMHPELHLSLCTCHSSSLQLTWPPGILLQPAPVSFRFLVDPNCRCAHQRALELGGELYMREEIE